MKDNLLFELLVEEMPANGVTSTINQFTKLIKDKFNENKFIYDKLDVFATCRRLVLYVEELNDTQEEIKKEIKGPAYNIAFDSENNATMALNGYLKSNNATLSDITTKEIKGIKYVYIDKVVKGESIFNLLNDIIIKSINQIVFGKSMTWSNCKYRFIRPIRNVLLKYGSKDIDIEIAGVKNNGTTIGHRTLSNREIKINFANDYFDELKFNKVIVNQNERKEEILKQFKNLELENNFNIQIDEDLLNEVNYLVEYPTAFVGKFDEEFLSLPSEAIILPMKIQQRYFPVFRFNKLINKFIGVRNGDDYDIHEVVHGNERVLKARLCDAKFFYKEDLSKGLEYFANKLDTVVYRKELGTIKDKVNRITNLANKIAYILNYKDLTKLDDACKLVKADLVSGMVNEFEELQGVMGRDYALKEGFDKDVSECIYSHYLPKAANDEVAKDDLGIIIGLADRIDSLCGAFATGYIPTGSKDQFGSRRDAIAVLNIILKNKLNIDLDVVVFDGLQQISKIVDFDLNDIYQKLIKFIENRFINILSEKYNQSVINVFVQRYSLNITSENLQILNSINENLKDENFINFVKVIKRANNLIKNKECTINLNYLTSEENNFINLIKEDKILFTNKLNDYLDNTLIVCDDKNVQNSRIALLSELINIASCDFDIVKLEV